MNLLLPEMEATRLRLTRRFGDAIDRWWLDLPDRVTMLSRRWSITVLGPVGRGNTSLVLRCSLADGTPAILKLVPDCRLAATETRALRAWQGSGRVPVVHDADFGAGALLMEAIAHVSPLKECAHGSLKVIGSLVRELHDASSSARTEGFETLASRIDFIFDRCEARVATIETAKQIIAPDALRSSHRLAVALAGKPSRSVLLHGDLHAGNILYGGPRRGLVAIDPRPCLGDAAFDAIDHVFWPEALPSQWLGRCDELARLVGCDRTRLWDWCRSLATVFAVARLANGASGKDVAALLDMVS